MNYKLYEVGGRIRDYYLGLDSKDVDYSVVIENQGDYKTPLDAFNAFRDDIVGKGYKVFQETPNSFTIRAMFPEDHVLSGVADFVLARKEISYIENTRQPLVELGTLEDDLLRRDFTINAMARDTEGNIIDPFGGKKDLIDRILRTTKDAAISFSDDPLRVVRALRFYITKDINLSDEIIGAIKLFKAQTMHVVSKERIREEFLKMFKHSTLETLEVLEFLKYLNPELYIILVNSFWLMPTNKK
jgi:tRNA nucleotidyltransferase/poly(A) polymerase